MSENLEPIEVESDAVTLEDPGKETTGFSVQPDSDLENPLELPDNSSEWVVLFKAPFPDGCPSCKPDKKYESKGSGKNLRSLEDALEDYSTPVHQD